MRTPEPVVIARSVWSSYLGRIVLQTLAKVRPSVEGLSPQPRGSGTLRRAPSLLSLEAMRALLALLPTLVACTSQNVVSLVEFGPISASIAVELGPVSAESGRDVNPRIDVSFSHNNPDCPVFGDDVKATIDGVRPDSFERGYYEEASGYDHSDGANCQPPYFSIDKVPPAQPRSTLRLTDPTADLVLEVDRLFVNPAMSLATPLVRGQLARIDVADDRQITNVGAEWWVEDGTGATIYDVMASVTPTGISLRMPSEVHGDGRLEIRVQLATPQLTCNGFSSCSVQIKGSQTFDATLN